MSGPIEHAYAGMVDRWGGGIPEPMCGCGSPWNLYDSECIRAAREAQEQRFGFRVERGTTGYPKMEPTDDWTVSLPQTGCARHTELHEVAGGTFGKPHTQTVAELEQFIAEAQEALTALRERRETSP